MKWTGEKIIGPVERTKWAHEPHPISELVKRELCLDLAWEMFKTVTVTEQPTTGADLKIDCTIQRNIQDYSRPVLGLNQKI